MQITLSKAAHVAENTHEAARLMLVLADHYGKFRLRLALHEILYFACAGHYIHLHCLENNVYVFREKISLLAQMLPTPYFVRCHRGVIVNIMNVGEIHRGFLKISDPKRTVLPVSKTYEFSLHQYFARFHGQ